jgi:hypothetical protein
MRIETKLEQQIEQLKLMNQHVSKHNEVCLNLWDNFFKLYFLKSYSF